MNEREPADDELRVPRERAPFVALAVAMLAALGGGYVLLFGGSGAQAHQYASPVPIPREDTTARDAERATRSSEPTLAPSDITIPDAPVPSSGPALTRTRTDRSGLMETFVSAHAASSHRKKSSPRRRPTPEDRRTEPKPSDDASDPAALADTTPEDAVESPAPSSPVPAVTSAPATPPGKLDVRVRPWATVVVDGREVGQTPFRPISLAPGKHTVRLTNPELQHDEQFEVEVRAGEINVVKRELAIR